MTRSLFKMLPMVPIVLSWGLMGPGLVSPAHADDGLQQTPTAQGTALEKVRQNIRRNHALMTQTGTDPNGQPLNGPANGVILGEKGLHTDASPDKSGILQERPVSRTLGDSVQEDKSGFQPNPLPLPEQPEPTPFTDINR